MTIRAVDMDTGEILGAPLKSGKKRQPNGFSGSWLSIAADMLIECGEHLTHALDLRVMCLLLGSADWGNGLTINQSDIARRLHTHRQHVNASLHRLRGIGIIEVCKTHGKVSFYRVNPVHAWRGNGIGHQVALRAIERDKKQAQKQAREADNVALLRVRRMQFQEDHPQPRKYASSGFKGVTAYRGRWRAQIVTMGQRLLLGTYDTPEAAHGAYLAARRELQIHKPADER